MSWFFMDDAHIDANHAGILSHYLYGFLGSDTVLIKVFSIFLLLFQAIQINRLVSLNRLTNENSLFAGVLYLLMLSTTLEFIPLHAQILANSFIIMMFLDVFKQTRNVQLHLDMFNVGLWVGLASLFYFPYIIFLIIGILGVIYLRTYKWVDTVRALLGVLVPYFLLATIVFMFDHLTDLWSMHLHGAMAFLDLNEIISWKGYVLIGVFALIFLVSVFMSRTFSTGVNIHVRKKISVLFITLTGSVVLMALCADTNIRSLIFLCFPMSVLMAAMFLELDPQFAEILHFLLLVMALVFQYIV
ncbi:MAG: hypothetical protein IPL46_07695 [Saprospiraceae bacterium]|nr:hypothetical protein [Saprospiraceae bacterium]